MKAYQLKIAIKNSKPLVWKRCRVPAGITFSQLAPILEVVTETEENAWYEFEFFQKKVQIREWQGDASSDARSPFEYRDALKTGIDPMMETEAWFTFRRETKPEFRCEIEKLLEEEPCFPAVLKQKEDPETWTWMDPEEMNRKLQQRFFMADGEKRQEEETEQKEDVIREESPVQEEVYRGPLLRDYLNAYDREDMEHIAEEIFLPGYRMMAEAELAQKLSEELLRPEVMKERLMTVPEESIEAMERALNRGCFRPDKKELELLLPIYELDYLIAYEDEQAEIAADVSAVFSAMNTPEYRLQRREQYWMWVCVRITELFYASAPEEIVHRMYKKYSGLEADSAEFRRIFESLPKRYKSCQLHEGKVIAREALLNNVYQEIENSQSGKSFYIPEAKEAEDYARHGYPSRDIWYRKLGEYLVETFGAGEEIRETVLSVLWDHACMGEPLAATLDWMKNSGFEFPSEESYHRFVSLEANAANNTRKLILRGHTPVEVQGDQSALGNGGRMPVGPIGSALAGSAKAEKETAGRKIYPNDPCPCGSGKKYKKCCGKNR
ncbi:MAG: IS1096 element passenger TnpR family protein [Monoglobales bacterium]